MLFCTFKYIIVSRMIKVDLTHITQIVNVNFCVLYHIMPTILFVTLKVNVNI